jgi:hypothetical protein
MIVFKQKSVILQNYNLYLKLIKRRNIMNYQGFEVTPVGNATISIIDGELNVSNIGDSGLDGVQVNTTGSEICTVHFAPFSNLVSTRGVVKRTILKKNGLGQVVTTAEQVEWYDPDSDKVIVGYNAMLLPNTFSLVGNLNGVEVFNFEETPDDVPPPEDDMPHGIWGALITAVAAVAVALITILSTKTTTEATTTKTTTEGPNGTTTTTTNVSSTKTDPQPFEIKVHGNTYVVDEFGIEYEEVIEGINLTNPNANSLSNAAMIITASKIGGFTITSITGGQIA